MARSNADRALAASEGQVVSRASVAPAIEASRRELPPAGMEGNVEGRIIPPDRLRHEPSAADQPLGVDCEMPQLATNAKIEKTMRPRPHGGGREQG